MCCSLQILQHILVVSSIEQDEQLWARWMGRCISSKTESHAKKEQSSIYRYTHAYISYMCGILMQCTLHTGYMFLQIYHLFVLHCRGRPAHQAGLSTHPSADTMTLHHVSKAQHGPVHVIVRPTIGATSLLACLQVDAWHTMLLCRKTRVHTAVP